MAMEQIYTGTDHKGRRIFQRAPYIDGGWYIVEHDGFQVWDTFLLSSEEQLVETFETFDEAIKFTKTLT